MYRFPVEAMEVGVCYFLTYQLMVHTMDLRI